ncbi:hypothetical protein A0H81_07246 [Grifola frondosa]|uniref:Uncharacterized protein n=1 Tax=Grifola frondosa TaxID=5627 RepID=A0A1C7M851_GRIFR|nr:hypothetical protein A0H81_07246 [Grifola frondosa]
MDSTTVRSYPVYEEGTHLGQTALRCAFRLVRELALRGDGVRRVSGADGWGWMGWIVTETCSGEMIGAWSVERIGEKSLARDGRRDTRYERYAGCLPGTGITVRIVPTRNCDGEEKTV